MSDNDRLTLDEFAAKLGHTDSRTLASWVSKGMPKTNPAPKPVDYRIEKGHARPLFDRAEAEAWIGRRPGQGRRASTGEPD